MESDPIDFPHRFPIDFLAGLAPKAVVGAVMRKLAHLIYGVIKSGQPFDASFSGLKLDFQDGI